MNLKTFVFKEEELFKVGAAIRNIPPRNANTTVRK